MNILITIVLISWGILAAIAVTGFLFSRALDAAEFFLYLFKKDKTEIHKNKDVVNDWPFKGF